MRRPDFLNVFLPIRRGNDEPITLTLAEKYLNIDGTFSQALMDLRDSVIVFEARWPYGGTLTKRSDVPADGVTITDALRGIVEIKLSPLETFNFPLGGATTFWVNREWPDAHLHAHVRTYLGGHLRCTGGANPLLFNPGYSLPGKLVAWFNAQDFTAGSTAHWIDRIAGIDASQAIAASRPTFSGGYVRFDGTDDYLTATEGLSVLPDGVEVGELWGLVDQEALPANTTNRRWFAYGTPGTGAQRESFRVVSGGINKFELLDETTTDFSGVHAVGKVYRDGLRILRIDGHPTAPASAVATINTVLTRLRVGANVSGTATGFWHGGIRHAMIVAGSLTELETQKLEAWLLWDVDRADLLPGDHPFKTVRPPH